MSIRTDHDDFDLGEASPEKQVEALLKLLLEDRSELRAFRNGLRLLADRLPARTTLRQALAFVAVADAESRGQEVTMGSIRTYLGDDGEGGSRAGQSVANTFSVFLVEAGASSLGWVQQMPSHDDRRKKFLLLSNTGVQIAKALAKKVHGAAVERTPSFEGDA